MEIDRNHLTDDYSYLNLNRALFFTVDKLIIDIVQFFGEQNQKLAYFENLKSCQYFLQIFPLIIVYQMRSFYWEVLFRYSSCT